MWREPMYDRLWWTLEPVFGVAQLDDGESEDHVLVFHPRSQNKIRLFRG